jgi:peptidoglycan L-alanyl-D-glutamate endopeptidase CwlK
MATCYRLSIRSLKRLEGVHVDLVRVVVRAIQICPTDFSVHEGLRDIVRQRVLVDAGKSQTMNSRHLTGHAVDLWLWPLDWDDYDRWQQLTDAMVRASAELDVPIECGSVWKTLKDWPHFQLPRSIA